MTTRRNLSPPCHGDASPEAVLTKVRRSRRGLRRFPGIQLKCLLEARWASVTPALPPPCRESRSLQFAHPCFKRSLLAIFHGCFYF
ncbi:hypothetical protein FKM82_028173 [Ascaphus truei]